MNLIIERTNSERAHGRLLNAQATYQEIENYFASDYFKARNSEIWSEVFKNNAEAQYFQQMTTSMAQKLGKELVLLADQHDLNEQEKQLRIQQIIRNEFENAEEALRWHTDENGNIDRMSFWGAFEKSVSFVTESVGSVMSVGFFRSFEPPSAPPTRVKGFSRYGNP